MPIDADAGLPPRNAGGGAPRSDGAWVAALVALDPAGFGGVVVRSSAGSVRDAWLARLAASLAADAPVRRIPLHVDDDRLLGGLDLAGTLQAGRVVADRGLLAAADGGIVVLAMAERVAAGTAARIAAALDTGELVVERAGAAGRIAARFGVVALDEGIGDDEGAPGRLAERLAFRLELGPRDDGDEDVVPHEAIVAARRALPAVEVDGAVVEGLCAAAGALGIASIRAPLLAVRAARGIAALAGRAMATADDAAVAARLVLAHRALQLPSGDASPAAEAPPPDAPRPNADPASADPPADDSTRGVPPSPVDADDGAAAAEAGRPPSTPEAGDPSAASEARPSGGPPVDAEHILAAALAALPPHLLDRLRQGSDGAPRQGSAGRSGAMLHGASRGRPIGVRRAVPRGGARLALLETLRAAAPWQRLRRAEDVGAVAGADADPDRRMDGGTAGPRPAVLIRREDFHVRRHALRRETTTIFVVDASGSSALHRLAEAKGAVELLLADCYVRRDSVALIAFRGGGAELLLPPTRSLARAKRGLAGLPGGGATPLAAGIGAAATLVDALRRRGVTPFVVLLTDGRGNVSRDGTTGRAAALQDALAASRHLRASGAATLLLDTSPQPQEAAARIADALGARYLPLPHAGAHDVSAAIQRASPAHG